MLVKNTNDRLQREIYVDSSISKIISAHAVTFSKRRTPHNPMISVMTQLLKHVSSHKFIILNQWL